MDMVLRVADLVFLLGGVWALHNGGVQKVKNSLDEVQIKTKPGEALTAKGALQAVGVLPIGPPSPSPPPPPSLSPGLRRQGDAPPKKKKDDRSTSSESKDAKSEDNVSAKDDSLQLSVESSDESTQEKKVKKHRNKYKPVSSGERRGWRKWHRKCTPCPEDEAKKWRDPSIKWICGAYQDARRSFKSACSMRLRNCQDGTMFVEIKQHRCEDDTSRGLHLFYDYKVRLTDESRGTGSSTSSEQDDSSSSESADTRRRMRIRTGRGKSRAHGGHVRRRQRVHNDTATHAHTAHVNANAHTTP